MVLRWGNAFGLPIPRKSTFCHYGLSLMNHHSCVYFLNIGNWLRRTKFAGGGDWISPCKTPRDKQTHFPFQESPRSECPPPAASSLTYSFMLLFIFEFSFVYFRKPVGWFQETSYWSEEHSWKIKLSTLLKNRLISVQKLGNQIKYSSNLTKLKFN